ncbi:actin related protein 2/3 complex [Pseudoscourfieldia marina]
MAAQPHQLAPVVSCFAVSADLSYLALCPNTSSVTIYRVTQDAANGYSFTQIASLEEHDQLVAGIDWCPVTNKLLTCAHDRNAYVWTRGTAEETWDPVLTILRTQRAALCCQWSPKGNKFAVGTAAKTACVCYYEGENNWWVSKLIKKGLHRSSVVDVRWHPNNMLLATASTDGCARVFFAQIPDADGAASAPCPFSTPLLEVRSDSGAWVHSLDWSPDGSSLAFVAHDATVCVVEGMGAPGFWDDGTDAASRATRVGVKNVRLRGLPMACVWFADAECVVVAGHEGAPMIVSPQGGGSWAAGALLGGGGGARTSKRASQFAEASALFQGGGILGGHNNGGGADSDAVYVKGKPPSGPHSACVTSIRALPRGKGYAFATAGVDGKLVFWPDQTLAGKMSQMAL